MAFLFDLGRKMEKDSRSPLNLKSWLIEQFIRPRMDTPAGYAVLLLFGVLVAGLVGSGGWQSALTLSAMVIFLPLLFASMFQPRFGLYMLIFLASVIPLLKRVDGAFPFSLLVDATLVFMAFGVFIHQIYPRDWSRLRSPLTWGVLIWLAYCLFQLFNPSTSNALAWLYSVRGTGAYWLLIPIGLFAIDGSKQVRQWIRFFVLISVLGAFYGFFQAIVGFQPFEQNWLYSHPEFFESVSLGGELRKYSFYSNPGNFGITMAVAALFAMGLGLEPKQTPIARVLWWSAASILIGGLLLSGTRTGFAMLPLGYLFFALLSWQRNVLILGLGLAMVWVGLIFAPVKSSSLLRLQSSFSPSKASSFAERVETQDFVQPYIQSHPIGNGLGSTGESGQIFSPYTLLSQFPPDSGFVQVAVETGWIGLLIYLGVIALFLVIAVKISFDLRRTRKHDYLPTLITAALVSLAFANYPHQSMLAFPNSLTFPILVAGLGAMMRENQSEELPQP